MLTLRWKLHIFRARVKRGLNQWNQVQSVVKVKSSILVRGLGHRGILGHACLEVEGKPFYLLLKFKRFSLDVRQRHRDRFKF